MKEKEKNQRKQLKLFAYLNYIAYSDCRLDSLEIKCRKAVLRYFPNSTELYLNVCWDYCYICREKYNNALYFFEKV